MSLSTALVGTLAALPLQEIPAAPGPLGGPLGTLLMALVVIALVLFLGRSVMSVAWRVVKLAVVLVGLAWLALTVAPMVT
jgi:hypothetical protein